MAAGAGAVGPKSLEGWEEMAKELLLKGFEELVALLGTPPPAVEQRKGA
jgi:hypothetical protein